MLGMKDSDWKGILNQCDNGIVLFDDVCNITFTNCRFLTYPVYVQQKLLKKYACKNALVEPPGCVSGYMISYEKVAQGYALIVKQDDQHHTHSDTVLSTMLSNIKQGSNIYQASVEAIHRALGWRWVLVTRFKQEGVETLAYWNGNSIDENFSFELAGTPCEAMIANERYTLFTDVAKAFPKDTALQEMGAKTYAGLIYRDANQKPIGHIMAMHDALGVDYHYAEDVITLAALALSADLLLANAESELRNVEEEARTDSLTNLYNRKMFDEHCLSVGANYTQRGQDSCLVLIDLNRFKQYNDKYGHQEGDVLLQLLATELNKIGRDSDLAFRIGGDEFTIILSNSSPSIVPRVNSKFESAWRRLSLITSNHIQGSIGYAFLDECNGDIDTWIRLADERMYEHKRSLNQCAE